MSRTVRHHEPLNKAHLPGRLTAKVAGLSFGKTYPWNLHNLRDQGGTVTIDRDPDNEFDPDAVQVLVNGVLAGHLPAGLAGRMAPELDAGAAWGVTGWEVLVQRGYDDRPGLSLTLERRHDA